MCRQDHPIVAYRRLVSAIIVLSFARKADVSIVFSIIRAPKRSSSRGVAPGAAHESPQTPTRSLSPPASAARASRLAFAGLMASGFAQAESAARKCDSGNESFHAFRAGCA